MLKVYQSGSPVMREMLIHSSGELFSVGAFNTLRLCDKSGVSIIHSYITHVHVQLHCASRDTDLHSLFDRITCNGR